MGAGGDLTSGARIANPEGILARDAAGIRSADPLLSVGYLTSRCPRPGFDDGATTGVGATSGVGLTVAASGRRRTE